MAPAADFERGSTSTWPFSFAVSGVVMSATLATRGLQSLAYDELFTVWVASRPFSDVVHQANLDGFTPPLFYFLVKALSLTGLANEDLRLLPVVFVGLAVVFGIEASARLFGPSSRWLAVSIVGGSAYLFTFAHELRPYSALLACSFFYLSQFSTSPSPRADLKAAIAAIVAVAFSYLGVAIVLSWFYECRHRVRASHRAVVFLVTLAACTPGLLKIAALTAAARNAGITWSGTPPAFPGMLLGLASLPTSRSIEVVGLVLLIVTGGVVFSSIRDHAASPFLLRTLFIFAATFLVLDGVVKIGFAPRYFALPLSVFLLLMVGALARLRRVGYLLALVVVSFNGLAIARYLWVVPAPRENWRLAMNRLEEKLGPQGFLLGFPFHHTAVAAHAYAPSLKVGGGYTSRTGPVYWYEPPKKFAGYSFADLRHQNDARDPLGRLSALSHVCVLSDEPDASKTASVFRALQELDGAATFDSGDPRLRVVCRSRP